MGQERNNTVLEREVNPKLGRGTPFYGDLVSGEEGFLFS